MFVMIMFVIVKVNNSLTFQKVFFKVEVKEWELRAKREKIVEISKQSL